MYIRECCDCWLRSLDFTCLHMVSEMKVSLRYVFQTNHKFLVYWSYGL